MEISEICQKVQNIKDAAYRAFLMYGQATVTVDWKTLEYTITEEQAAQEQLQLELSLLSEKEIDKRKAEYRKWANEISDTHLLVSF